MPAITVRNLPESVHATLKQRAAGGKLSVEALVRHLLATWAALPNTPMQKDPTDMSGFSEAPATWPEPPSLVQASHPDLWGAMKGTVHIPPDTDLAAPLNEAWKATA
jgi:plasmid stability protein